MTRTGFKRWALTAVAAAFFIPGLPAWAQSQADVAAKITSQIPTTGRGAITASGLRDVLNSLNGARGQANGIAGLDENGRLIPQQTPSVLAPNALTLPSTDQGSTGSISGMCSKASGSASCRSLADRATDVIQAADFGVKCDGTTNDGPAILAATNAAAALGGRDVIFPSSATCRLQTFLAPPSKTRWVSRGGTVFYLDPAMSVSPPVGGAGRAILFNGVSDILIDGITFQGAGVNSLPCPAPCNRILGILFQNANNVVIRNSIVQDFGYGTTLDIPAPGIIVFGGSGYLIDNTIIRRTSGDNLAFSNGTTNVEVRGSTFSFSTGDSALVCTIGGSSMNFHNNHISGPTVSSAPPIVVMDRCTNWQISNNQVVGGTTGQGIRVARYGDTVETNNDFTISGNTIMGTAVSISVEAAATKQGANGNSVGGGRFAITGNTMVNPTDSGIVIADSEVGTITGNVISRAPNSGILVIGYTAATSTGSVAITGNTITGAGGQFGIRQLNAGGTMTPIAVGPNVITGVTNKTSLLAGNTPLSLPTVTPSSGTIPCNTGEILGLDAAFLYGCVGQNTVKKLPWQPF